jgi:hypothetical protein
MPPPLFSQKSPQTIENKGRGYEKERQESSRAGKRMKRRGLRLVTGDSKKFTVFSCKLLVSEGKRRGEDWLTAEFAENAEGTGDKALRHRGHRAGLIGSRDGDDGRGGSGRGRRRVGFFATFTAHDSRRGTRGQLVEGTDWVQVAGFFSLERVAGRAEETIKSKSAREKEPTPSSNQAVYLPPCASVAEGPYTAVSRTRRANRSAL